MGGQGAVRVVIMGTAMSQPDLPLVQYMKRAGLTTDRLAELVGFHSRTIDNWTSRARRPSYPQLVRLAKVLDCTPADLVDPNPRPVQRPTNPTRRPMGTTGTVMATQAAADRFRSARQQAPATPVAERPPRG